MRQRAILIPSLLMGFEEIKLQSEIKGQMRDWSGSNPPFVKKVLGTFLPFHHLERLRNMLNPDEIEARWHIGKIEFCLIPLN